MTPTLGDMVTAMVKKFTDEGKVVEAGWQSYRMLSIPPDAPEVQVMQERSSRQGRQGPEDINSVAYRIMRDSTSEEPNPENEAKKNPAAVSLGRLGGLKGGKARADKLSPERKSEIASLAAKARWQKGH